jgi:hypothetical protein
VVRLLARIDAYHGVWDVTLLFHSHRSEGNTFLLSVRARSIAKAVLHRYTVLVH